MDTSGYTLQDDSSSCETGSSSAASSDSRACYIVFESALLVFFTICHFCASKSVDVTKVVMGSYLRITQKCIRCRQRWIWESQPMIGNIPAGNIYTSAAILFAGALPAQALGIFSILRCYTISTNTFFRHQKQYLQPAITTTWRSHQSALLSGLKEHKLSLAGDGRADSPGHSAKYGLYTVIETSCNKVLDYRLVQSNEVGGSYHMEKEGLQRVLQFLKEQGLTIENLVTDRHKQINKWLRETYPAITHYYDVWHVAKGFRKKLEAAAKLKDCEIIGNWQRSIIHYLYWSVCSTPDGDSETVLAKWLSLENDVHNKHKHSDRKFPKSTHGRLRARDRKKKWFKRHSKASEKLSALLTNKHLCKDITRLSPVHQTSSLEAFHSVIIHFAPKYVPFSYHGMNCRLALAALHFNENGHRRQAVTQKGEECYDILYPKYKKGGHIVRKVTVNPTYRYIDILVEETVRCCDEGVLDQLPSDTPGPLCSQYERPDKPTAIKSHKSRFSL